MRMISTTPNRLAALVLAVSSLGFSSAEPQKSFGPTLESARENGLQIFNSIHNAMREFGSALHHNGMSLYPGVIPKGVLLYHGTSTKEIPTSFEWLAFEIEHAEGFARGGPPGPKRNHRKPPPGPPPMGMEMQDGHPPPNKRLPRLRGGGYLHIYQSVRPLNVLYIDGMAAGKTDMGTVDTQDILLAGNKTRTAWDEWIRAEELCTLAQQWKIDGFIRMEPGFEIIYCDFTDGLRLVSANKRPPMDESGSENDLISGFEWVRAASQRYNGIGSSRVVLDYSSMVSAFFYPINLTNPDPKRPELPRLLGASSEEMDVVREHVAESVARSISHLQAPIDWQGVSDMIVTRYIKQLPFIAQTDSIEIIKAEMNSLLNVYIDYSETDDGLAGARQRCVEFFLQPVQPQTSEDKLIYAAFENTTATICAALFKVREIVIEDPDVDESAAMGATKQIIGELMESLSWSNWKECGACKADEVCFIAMWPMGNVEDHYNPSCLNFTALARGRNTYWRFSGGPPHGPPPPSTFCADGQPCEEHEDFGSEEL
ncbi:uncharacterized protein GGS22DRAFT_111438 [Annulohypoxylon maeteangense]|uniref:uncharacterized protein n=1 Tax=Annulohypoxylon maeteangense TaxID=1927788 RepID=UPI002008E534|nr:uncharacterized protein GGS22DRAFT_111438 [Annulohypoxylon maeteangense]KAI0887573.1 hypothetical protein GGS22DRAFT_111438 [Annulohypoxylon maeteangense]